MLRSLLCLLVVCLGCLFPSPSLAPDRPPPVSAVADRHQQFAKPLLLEVTAYTIHDEGMDGRGITASGRPARPWLTAAADPACVPMFSRLYIPALAQTPSRGYFVVEDTGGAIRGLRLDLCVPDRQTAFAFGRRHLEVYLLD